MGHSRHRRSKRGTGSAWLPGLMLGLALLATVIIVCGVIIYVEQPSSTSDDTSPEGYIRAKLAEDDDAGRFRDASRTGFARKTSRHGRSNSAGDGARVLSFRGQAWLREIHCGKIPLCFSEPKRRALVKALPTVMTTTPINQ